MGINPNLRLKIRNFFKKYGKIIGIFALVWLAIILINQALKINTTSKEPSTTYTPHEAILDSSQKTPKKVKNSIEEFIEKYIEHCNKEQYTDAYNMLSDECKEYFVSFNSYARYVSNKFDEPKIYSIQNYSNKDGKYIYNVKLYNDILASGLTNSVYNYQEEKITASYDEDKNIVFSVGNFIEEVKINNVQENEYLKIDVKSKIVKYSNEIYKVRLTNRSENIIVIKNSELNNEIVLKSNNELRNNINEETIILKPGETTFYNLTFDKYYDDTNDSQSLIFNSIRVVEQYIEENPNEENAVYKFSAEVILN